ncbi:oxygen-independent coproporphyrinogen III oxidase [Yoonia sp. MH D7]
MKHASLAALGLFDARVPRYTSYPPATAFSPETGVDFQEKCIRRLDPAEPVSVYIHIPFCERLCWFCACRTQGTTTLSPVVHYIDVVKKELTQLRKLRPDGLQMGRLHWGGGTPTILPPDLIRELATAIKQVFPPADNFEFSVEIDPTMVDADKIEALAEVGMTRASIGIQDFAPDVQDAIGRHQSFEQTKTCVDLLRNAGITSLNADLVYGLPHQTLAKMDASIDQVLSLDPDRIALFGYAHVPHMAKRQKLIKQDTLPDDYARHDLSELATERFVTAGMAEIGIDHFAKPNDTLAKAAKSGALRRNFQGYTVDSCPTLIGIGASSISRFSDGYVQNAAATAAYISRIETGRLAGARGFAMTPDDQMRARLIEMIMCDFSVDLLELRDTYGSLLDSVIPDLDKALAQFKAVTRRTANGFEIIDHARHVARLVANVFDTYRIESALYSKAS